jgi:acyl-CoA reductase-like NAD-dependent aldehyde dehydrogenase
MNKETVMTINVETVNSELKPFYGPLIGGKFWDEASGERFAVINPATGEHIADIARCGTSEIDAAVTAAHAAFPAWKATPTEERSALLLKLADAIEKDIERLTLIETEDVGRARSEIRKDHLKAISQYRYFAGAILTYEDYGKSIPNGYFIAKREPIGVCGQIIPWNVPAIMTAFKMAPALAAGNTVVLKPDENASLSTLEFARHVKEIFPPGVVNIVPGYGEEAGVALTAHPGVDKLSFTGSGEIGRAVSRAGADRLVPVTLELGGKGPNIVFPDIEDIDAVVDNVLFGSMYCNGQSCLAGTRLFIHDSLYTDFLDKLSTAAERLTLGDPLNEETRIGCMISEKQGKRVLSYIEKGQAEGASLVTGGSRKNIQGYESGYFIEPTIFEARNDMRIAQEEIFGPVLSVLRWKDYDTMINEANNTIYGLSAGIYTSNIGNAMKTANLLEAGSVWINQFSNLATGVPFGGVKESGYGREHGREALNFYTQVKAITFQSQVVDPWYVG